MRVSVQEDEPFGRRVGVVQRAIWLVMLATAVAALLGAFGGGVLAEGSAEADGSPAVTVAFDRLARYQSPTELMVEVRDPPPGAGEQLDVAISRGYLAEVRVTSVTPEPESVLVGDDVYVYRFQVADWSGAARIHFKVEPDEWGVLSGDVRATVGDAAGERASFRQFVYP